MNEFRRKSIHALKWSFIGNVFQQIAQFTLIIILSRLLLPSDFGLIAMVSVFASFAMTLSDFGFTNALIQAQQVNKKEIDTVFWFNLLIGTIIFTLFFLFAELIAGFYNENRLVVISRIISFTFITNAIQAVPKSMIVKDLRFKTLTITTFISFTLSSLIAIVLAFLDVGYMALVFRNIINSLLSLGLILFITKYIPTSGFKIARLKRFMSFGLHSTGNWMLTYWMRNFDSLLIGKMIGQIELGLYNRAYQIMLYPLSNVANVIRQVLFPAFSNLQDEIGKIKSIYLKITQAIVLTLMPLVVIVFVLTHEIVYVLLGSKWIDMVPLLHVLVLVAIPQIILSINGTVYLAIGKPHIPFRLNGLIGTIMFIGFYFGIKWNGVMGLIYVYLLINVLSFYPTFYYAARCIKLTLFEQIDNLKWIFIISLVMGLILYFMNSNLINVSINTRFFALIPCSLLTYLVMVLLCKDKIGVAQEIEVFIKGRIGK